MKKRLIKGGLALLLAAGFALSPVHTKQISAAPTVYFEAKQTQEITRGTYLHTITRVTSAGLLDISVLDIPLDDPYLAVDVFNSNIDYGRKQPTTTLLADNNAIAGVNGDFFGLAGTHSVPLGLEMINGAMSIQGGANGNGNTSASLLIGDNDAFITYVRPQASLRLDGQVPFNVDLVNKVTNLAWPSFLTRGYVTSTACIDARLGRSYKIKVRNGIITAITFYTVNVPENGFVVIMNPATFAANRHHFRVGMSAEMHISANIDLNAVHTAISGSYRILQNGAVPEHIAGRAGRAPRTVLGLNAAGDRLILMTIDGRSHSIGATLPEAAHYIRQFDAHNAINLDGGGSTTMAASLPGTNNLSVINTPSDGRQRSVINTIGLLNNSQRGPVTSLAVNAPQQNIPVGMASSFTVLGFDDYINHTHIYMSGLEIALADARMTDGRVVPERPGRILMHVAHSQVYTWHTFNAINVAQIIPSTTNIHGAATLTFTGVDHLGQSTRLDPAQLRYQVYPATLGTMENGRFTPTGGGNGWLRVATPSDSAFTYIPISINRRDRSLLSFDGSHRVNFSAWPQNVTGAVHLGDRPHITYNFTAGTHTQAAYINFPDAAPLHALAYRISVYGNNSGHWLRGNILDANGNDFVIDFSRGIDFTSWRDLTAQMPSEAVLPVTLHRIYPVSLSQAAAGAYRLYFNNLRVYENYTGTPIAIPAGTTARDPLRATTLGPRQDNQHDITFMGLTTYQGKYPSEAWQQVLQQANAAHLRDAAASLSGANLHNAPQTIHDLYIIPIDAYRGGIAATRASQWGRLTEQLAAAPSNNIVIHTNRCPSTFTHSQEFQLLHDILTEQAADGRNVFVVANGRNAAIQLRDGVRYITLPALYQDGEPNPDFSILRFRLAAGNLQYFLERVFP